MSRYQDNVISLIKRDIREKGITQKDFSDKLGISEASLSRYLAKQRTFSLTIAIKLADYFNISLDSLVGRNN